MERFDSSLSGILVVVVLRTASLVDETSVQAGLSANVMGMTQLEHNAKKLWESGRL